MAEGLLSAYRGVVCDLDGVVYRGPAAVPGAVAALSSLPIPVVYATNNASRPPEAVAEHLRELGLADDVGGLPRRELDAADQGAIARSNPTIGREGEVDIRCHPPRATLDRIGRLREVGGADLGAETLKHRRDWLPRMGDWTQSGLR